MRRRPTGRAATAPRKLTPEQETALAARRRVWRAAQPFVDADRLVFIDETGASTKMTRLYGRAPRGQRLIASAPFRALEDQDLRGRAET